MLLKWKHSLVTLFWHLIFFCCVITFCNCRIYFQRDKTLRTAVWKIYPFWTNILPNISILSNKFKQKFLQIVLHYISESSIFRTDSIATLSTVLPASQGDCFWGIQHWNIKHRLLIEAQSCPQRRKVKYEVCIHFSFGKPCWWNVL